MRRWKRRYYFRSRRRPARSPLSPRGKNKMPVDVWQLYDLDPVPLDDETVWRGARQMMELFPEGASAAATERADKALEQGDLENFNLWQRIAQATEEMERAKPGASDAIN